MVKRQLDLEEIIQARLNDDGHEVVSSIPMAPPLGYVKQPSMVDHVRKMVRSEMLRREVEAAGVETFEDADDFDIADDPLDPATMYEEVFEPVVEDVVPVPAAPSSTAPVGVPPVVPVDPPASS